METSKTEFKVCAYTAAGYEAKQIASILYRSYYTIVGHLKMVRVKNDLKNIADITREFVLAHGDPKQYIKTLLLVIQVSAALMSMETERRFKLKTSPKTYKIVRKI